MIFAGLTSAYVVRSDTGNWLIFELPNTFYLSTAVIIASSLSLYVALQMAKTIKSLKEAKPDKIDAEL
jgi:cytochrome c oxidase subunit 3